MNEPIQHVIRAALGGHQAYRDLLAGEINRFLKKWARRTSQGIQSIQARAGGSDVGQDTAMAVWKKLGSFRGNTYPEFESWMNGVLHNKLITILRSHLADPRDIRQTRSAGSDSTPHEFPASGDTPSQAAQANEELKGIESLRDAMGQLRKGGDTDAAEILEMRYLRELKHHQIAAALGINEATAKKRVERALGKLRKIMGLVKGG